jgi:hypothetical protein
MDHDHQTPRPRGEIVFLQPAPYVVIEKAAEMTGYTRRAIEEKIAKGVWLEGREWVKAPDGRRLISMKGYVQWVEQGRRG